MIEVTKDRRGAANTTQKNVLLKSTANVARHGIFYHQIASRLFSALAYADIKSIFKFKCVVGVKLGNNKFITNSVHEQIFYCTTASKMPNDYVGSRQDVGYKT